MAMHPPKRSAGQCLTQAKFGSCTLCAYMTMNQSSYLINSEQPKSPLSSPCMAAGCMPGSPLEFGDTPQG